METETLTSEYYQNPRSEMARYVPSARDRVLEVGCGAGSFISSLQGCQERWGIEPTAAARQAQTKLTKVLNGLFDAVKHELPKSYFDVIICNDVIEHMVDHESFLREISQYLAPGGILVGSIPNVRFYDNLFKLLLEKDWHYTESGILDRTHLAFFTKKSLRRVLEAAGYEVITLDGLHYDHMIDRSWTARIYQLTARLIAVLTLGSFSDTRCLQFAFQAKVLASTR